MKNKRTLKRAINAVCEALMAEAVAASLYGNERHKGAANGVINSVLHVRAHYLSRVSHIEPGMPARAYFKDLCGRFTADAEELVEQISNL